MKNKIFKSLICSTLIPTLTTGCVDIGIENDNLKDNTNNYTSIVASEDYTTQNIYNKTLKYKKANPTSLWDCDDNFGAGEIDTVLIPSKDGNPVEKYYDMANISGIYFQTGDDAIKSDDALKARYQRWYGISNLKIENIEKNTGKLINYINVAESNLTSGKYIFDERHIIYSKIRPNLNKVAMPNFKGLCSADSYPILVNEKCKREYLVFVLRSKYFLNYILGYCSRTNIPKVNKEQLSGFNLPNPPIELQNKFAQIVEKINEQKRFPIYGANR